MRSVKAAKNSLTSLILNTLIIMVGLLAQKIFINTLGTTYAGVNSLLTNIVSLLALAELGLSAAMNYELYGPLANKDYESVKSLIFFYKNAYRWIALIVCLLALVVAPFIPLLIVNNTISENIYILFGFFTIDAVFSYFLVYKRAILYADQKNYLIDSVHAIYLLLLNLVQIAVLLITKSFYLYLAIKIVFRLFENIILNFIVNSRYEYIKNNSISPLSQSVKKGIYKKIRGLAVHRIGGYLVLSTDNIVISIFLGVAVVGLYANYYLVIAALILVFWQASSAVTSSVGNMLLKTNINKSKSVYDKISFANLGLSIFAATSFLVLMNGFITLWLGERYLLNNVVLYVLSFNLFLTLLRSPIMSYKEAAGIFHEDRLMPVIESTINLVFSVLLVKTIGLPGVFIGTAFSILFLHLYSYPRYVHTVLFKSTYNEYYLEFFKKLFIGITTAIITYLISRNVKLGNEFFQFGFDALICVFIPAIIIYVLYRKHENYIYFKSLMNNLVRIMGRKLLWER